MQTWLLVASRYTSRATIMRIQAGASDRMRLSIIAAHGEKLVSEVGDANDVRRALHRVTWLSVSVLLALGCAPRLGVVRPAPEWVLLWSDEFDGAAGAPVNSRYWEHDSGDGCSVALCGWGNQEKESYRSGTDNVALDGSGRLAIVARQAPPGAPCYYGSCRYTSGRIKTKGKVTAQPGRIEARIRIPSGQGLWPAFWALGDGYPRTRWPLAGELDIMENHGSNPAAISSAIHGPGYSGSTTPFVHNFPLSRGSFSDDFHLFAVEWDSTRVRFMVDDVEHYRVTRVDVESKGSWVFDQPVFLILNLAVGGHFDGDPVSDRILPATMLVDFVRVYARAPATTAH